MKTLFLAGAAVAALAGAAQAADDAKPWMNTRLSPDARADLLLGRMSLDEEIGLLHGHFPVMMKPAPEGVIRSAGYFPGVPRLGVPALHESDASLGVANAGRGDADDATALPSGLALAATFDPEVVQAGGAMIGKQARQKGFNIMLAGGADLTREPRNGRNFEYLGEDPLLAGTLAGASIRGIQSAHVVSTAKHFALNDQETGRQVLNVTMDEAAARESDLLAFEIAIEQGQPGSVMCSYNRVNGTYACENPELLTGVLRDDWGYRGWVMSDWGAVHSLGAAKAGLDQQSGQEIDRQVFFDKPLRAALKSGELPPARVHQMAHRVLRSLFAAGVMDHPTAASGLNARADDIVSQKAAEAGIVLLKNEGGLLPLTASARKIAVIGGHADIGVMSGGGSSQVIPVGSTKFPSPNGAPPWGGGIIFHASSPLKAIAARAKGAKVSYADGTDLSAGAALARDADVVVVFATQWATEGMDAASLSLPDGQDALISAVAAANPHTVVVLETGGPVLMPWLDKVGAVVEAWYAGSGGGESIARVLSGEVNPSGRLPITFPAGEAQLPNPELPGLKDASPVKQTAGPPPEQAPFEMTYPEGSDAGYRWYARTGRTPLFPFGRGLSYSRFSYGGLKVTGGRTLTVSFTVTNTGRRAGADVPQVYLSAAPHRTQQRLIGWSKVELKPGESRRVSVTADRRLLADWDKAAHGWRLDGGGYKLFVGPDAATPVLTGTGVVQAARLKP